MCTLRLSFSKVIGDFFFHYHVFDWLISKDSWVSLLRSSVCFRMWPTSWTQEISHSKSVDYFWKSLFARPTLFCNIAARECAIISLDSMQRAFRMLAKWPLFCFVTTWGERKSFMVRNQLAVRSSELFRGTWTLTGYGNYSANHVSCCCNIHRVKDTVKIVVFWI